MGCCATNSNKTVINEDKVTDIVTSSALTNKNDYKKQAAIKLKPKKPIKVALNAWEEALLISKNKNNYLNNSFSLSLICAYIHSANIEQLIPKDVIQIINKYVDTAKRSLYGIGENTYGSLGIGRKGRTYKFTQCVPKIDVLTICPGQNWIFVVSTDHKLYFSGSQQRYLVFCAPSITDTDDYRQNTRKRTSLSLHPFFDGSTPSKSVKMMSSKNGWAAKNLYLISINNNFYGMGHTYGYGKDQHCKVTPKLFHQSWMKNVLENKIKIVDIQGAESFCLFLTNNGFVYACGTRRELNFPKQNDMEWSYVYIPQRLPFIKDVVQIESYSRGPLYLCKDGNIYGKPYSLKHDFFLDQDYDANIDKQGHTIDGILKKIDFFHKNNIKITAFDTGTWGKAMYCVSSNYHLYCFGQGIGVQCGNLKTIPTGDWTGREVGSTITVPTRIHSDVFDETKAKIKKLRAGFAHCVTLCDCNGINQVITMGMNRNAQCSPKKKLNIPLENQKNQHELKKPHLLTNEEIGVGENAVVVDIFANNRMTWVIIEQDII